MFNLAKVRDDLKHDKMKTVKFCSKLSRLFQINETQNDEYYEMDDSLTYKSSLDEKHQKLEDILNNCNCLPGCKDIKYKSQVTHLNYPWKEKFNTMNVSGKQIFKGIGVTKLKIYFNVNEVDTFERNELYGPTDFLSNFGGLLGLFTGFSILSIMEIIYFLTIRIWGNKILFNRWYGKPDD